MNDDDQFEKRLGSQPLRPVPPAWRDEVLLAARQGRNSHRPSLVPHAAPGFFSTLNAQLSTFLWPCPRAWAGLAAAWLLVLGLNFAGHEPSLAASTPQVAPPSPQLRQMLRQQEQLLAELVGRRETTEGAPSKSLPPEPHSQRRMLMPPGGTNLAAV